jgi:hypothetical protein
MFSGQFEAEKTIKFHENQCPRRYMKRVKV